MAVKNVSWTSQVRLSCAGCTPADVIICLKDDLVAQKKCPLDPMVDPETTENDDFPWTTIDGQLVSYTRFQNNCSCFYKYILSYEDEQIVEGTTILSSDILGVFCRGCLTTYIDEKVGNEVKLELIPSTPTSLQKLRLTSQHGCVFEFDYPPPQV